MKNRARVVLLFCISISFLTHADAQTRPSPAAPEKAPVARTNIDETFELNIVERRITESNFEASTSVSTDGDAGLAGYDRSTGQLADGRKRFGATRVVGND